MRYFILETQFRTDGDINFVKTEKYTFASAMAYYYSRKSAYYLDTTYTSASVAILDERLQVIEQCNVETSYVEPVEEEGKTTEP